MGASLARSLSSVLVAASAAIVIVAVAILLFANPVWFGFEQERSGVDRLTGYSIADVHRVTNGEIGEIAFGPGTFLQEVAGVTVLDPRERQHLVDVRGVVLTFFGIALVALVILVAAAVRARGSTWLWRSIAAGSAVLAGAVMIVGLAFALAFDATFEFFHRLFFAGGTYSFDPLTERLVQLYPEQLWSDTFTAAALLVLVVAVAVTFVALRRVSQRAEAVRSAGVPSKVAS